MWYDEKHLASMNRSGQRRGAVGSKPTQATRWLINEAREGMISPDAKVTDFGAGKWAQQTHLLRAEGFSDVTPYDVGANTHNTESGDIHGSDVVLLSNVLNVQDTVRNMQELLYFIRDILADQGILICNLPRTPRYGNITERDVIEGFKKAGFEIIGQWKERSGTVWEVWK
jgi:hypothetical protein